MYGLTEGLLLHSRSSKLAIPSNFNFPPCSGLPFFRHFPLTHSLRNNNGQGGGSRLFASHKTLVARQLDSPLQTLCNGGKQRVREIGKTEEGKRKLDFILHLVPLISDQNFDLWSLDRRQGAIVHGNPLFLLVSGFQND